MEIDLFCFIDDFIVLLEGRREEEIPVMIFSVIPEMKTTDNSTAFQLYARINLPILLKIFSPKKGF